jgi:hypothetical protein
MEKTFPKEQFGDTGLLVHSWKKLEFIAACIESLGREHGSADLQCSKILVFLEENEE